MVLYLLNDLNKNEKQHYNNIFNNQNSPLHTRKLNNISCCDELDKILEHLNLSRIIVGHTPNKYLII